MALASKGTLGAVADSTAGTQISLTTVTTAAAIGDLVIVIVASDNRISTTDVESNEHGSVEDGVQGWTKLAEWCNGNGAQDAGAVVSIWAALVSSAVPIGSTITCFFNTVGYAKSAISAWCFTTPATDLNVSAFTASSQDAADPASLLQGSLGNVEHLVIRAIASESSDTTALTQTTDYSLFNQAVSTGGASAANMGIRGEWRIFTGGDIGSDPTLFSADHASAFVALTAVEDVSAALAQTISGFTQTITASQPVFCEIGDLDPTDRLRTGTLFETQDPVDGSERDSVDGILAGTDWDTPSQVAGYTAANIMEVEAKYLAARMTMRPDEANYPPAGWTVGRYLYCNSNFAYAANSGNTPPDVNQPEMHFCWNNSNGICVMKKITGTLIAGAAVSPLAGTIDLKLWRLFGLSCNIPNTNVTQIFPPAANKTQTGPAGLTTALGTTGLVGNQPPSQAYIAVLLSALTNTQVGFRDAVPFSICEYSRGAAAGVTVIQNEVMYDYQRGGEMPLILAPGTGIACTFSFPAGALAGSNQVRFPIFQFQWDEWTLSDPGDR